MTAKTILTVLIACICVSALAFPATADAQTKKKPTIKSVDAIAETLRAPKSDKDGDGHDAIAAGGDDCDDNDANRYPGNVEVADAIAHDEDCDASTFGTLDADGDGYVSSTACNRQPDGSFLCGTDCADNKDWVHPGQIDILNGEDDDCDGGVDEDQSLETVRRLLNGES